MLFLLFIEINDFIITKNSLKKVLKNTNVTIVKIEKFIKANIVAKNKISKKVS